MIMKTVTKMMLKSTVHWCDPSTVLKDITSTSQLYYPHFMDEEINLEDH